jgi:hypothetical protein
MKINSKVVSDRFDDEVVVVNLESGVYYSFRGAAVEIWTRVEAGASTKSIHSRFVYSDPSQENKINLFIEFLTQENLVIPGEPEAGQGDSTDDPLSFTWLEFSKFEDMADLIMIDPIHEIDPKKGWPNKTD